MFNKTINRKDELIDIEKLLTFIEVELEYNPSQTFSDLKENVINLIRQTLRSFPGENVSNNSEYNLFVSDLQKEDTIITFNWDLLLDERLKDKQYPDNEYSQNDNFEEEYKNQWNNFLYNISGMKTARMYKREIKEPYIVYSNNIGLYLKIHGSIDWFYCPNSSCIAYARTFPVKSIEEDYFCGECHTALKPLIIPPVLNKSYKNYPFINLLWNTAIKEISIAEKIVIWGYSLPPTDFYANWLLRQTGEILKIVNLINPACANKRETKGEIKNPTNTIYNNEMKSIFKDKKEITFNYFESYRDYHEKICILDKVI